MFDYNISLLIVEDDDEQAFVIQTLLKRNGFDSKIVSTGAEAIDYIVQHPDTLILLDYNLPDITGKQVVEALKKIDYRVEFITMTAFGNEKVAVEMMKLGARDYVVKDMNFMDFLPAVVKNTSDRIITERKLIESQEALRVSKEMYFELFENSADAIYFTSLDGSIIAFNNSMLQLFGTTTEDICSKNALDFYSSHDDRQKFRDEIARAGYVKNFEVTLIDKNKKELFCLISATPRKAHDGKIIGYNGIIHDITAIKQAEEKLKESEDRYRILFERVPVGVYRTTPDGRLLDANPAMVELLAYPDQESIINANASDFYAYSPDRKKWLDEIDEKVVRPSYEERLITRDNRVIWVRDSAMAIKDKFGKIICYEGVMKDITDLKNSEEKLKRLVRSLTKSNETIEKQIAQLNALNSQLKQNELDLKELNAKKDKFFSIIAHDLKSPFTGFMGLTDLLSNDFDTLDRGQIIDISLAMSKSARQIYQLLENLLEWSRLQNGSFVISPANVNVAEVFDNVTSMHASNAKNKNISIYTEVPGQIEAFADKEVIQTILRNLIANAIKFTHAGGSIMLSARQSDNSVTISVADTGVGMSKETINKLFRIDVHHSTPGTYNEKGTGLGLILCDELTKASNGTLLVESAPGRGSMFTISLPAASSEAAACCQDSE